MSDVIVCLSIIKHKSLTEVQKKWNFTQQTNKMEGKCNGSIGFYDNDDDDDEDQCAVVWQRRDIVNCSPKDPGPPSKTTVQVVLLRI